MENLGVLLKVASSISTKALWEMTKMRAKSRLLIDNKKSGDKTPVRIAEAKATAPAPAPAPVGTLAQAWK